ncbi:MAG: DNA-processing protein DprA [Clostridia bacterium]|nr:DNA-processing protein DprA [Clostridia bacterium]
MTEQERLWLWLNYGTEHNVKLFNSILNGFDSIEEAHECAVKGERGAFLELSDGVWKRLTDAADERFMARYTGWLSRHKIGVATLLSENYPALLKEISDPPSLLFYRGDLNPDVEFPIAIIGSRSCTSYGKDIARQFGRQLVEKGATVVTGLAAGIDSYAACGALDATDAQMPVIGVLGCGIDVIYPNNNAYLYDGVAERGALITEFLPKTQPLSYNFPIRNRLISGLSLGVLVVEAGERSGASITAGYALEQGRDVFAVPGRITDVMSATTNRMIQRGEAKPVFAVSDILCEYMEGILELPYNATAQKIPFSSLTEIEKQIYSELIKGEKNSDELYDSINCSIADLHSALTSMEFSGIIKQLPGKVFACDTIRTKVVADD